MGIRERRGDSYADEQKMRNHKRPFWGVCVCVGVFIGPREGKGKSHAWVVGRKMFERTRSKAARDAASSASTRRRSSRSRSYPSSLSLALVFSLAR